MRPFKPFLACVVCGLAAWIMSLPPGLRAQPATPAVAEPLVWDNTVKEYQAKAGDTNAILAYSVTNVSSSDIVIRAVRPSCGCTVAKLPMQPWTIPAQSNGQFQVVVDLRGKRGTLNKYISVDTSIGYKVLILKVYIPEPPGGGLDARGKNMMIALADRQAVFKGTCVSCHVDTTKGKTGEDLYEAACGICHDSDHRATMVPELKTKRDPKHRGYWHEWTAKGKPGTLMPAFALDEGGPLTEAQIKSLVDYLVKPLAKESTSHPPSTPAGATSVMPLPPR